MKAYINNLTINQKRFLKNVIDYCKIFILFIINNININFVKILLKYI